VLIVNASMSSAGQEAQSSIQLTSSSNILQERVFGIGDCQWRRVSGEVVAEGRGSESCGRKKTPQIIPSTSFALLAFYAGERRKLLHFRYMHTAPPRTALPALFSSFVCLATQCNNSIQSHSAVTSNHPGSLSYVLEYIDQYPTSRRACTSATLRPSPTCLSQGLPPHRP